MFRVPSIRTLAFTSVIAAAVASTATAYAQVVVTPAKPVIGSSNPVSADSTVPRPDTKPCTVTLFTNLEFADFNTKNYTYTPPTNCPGPWAKVVFTADFTVTAGRQFDRTEQFYLGGANILFGTTAEPRAALSPSWHVENDITDLSALLTTTQAGTAILGNFVGTSGGVDYTGIIYANAHLLFYPESKSAPAPRVPDVVIGMPGNGGAATVNTSTDQLTQSVTLPKNVEKAYLDVISQSQSNDEFWYLCVPNDLASELESCPSTGFRETEVSIDGTPAGVAPVYPWIYTGGIDPYLWEPIPGVQTLNFKAFRVDLTPFAGLLSNGKPHTVAVSVFNADSYFAETATLLAYTDKDSKQITGEVVSNTLSAEPTQAINNKIAVDGSGNVSGYVTVSSKREFQIVGNIHTSHGTVTTQVNGLLNFSNKQNFTINNTAYKQDLVQSTRGGISSLTTENGVKTVGGVAIDYPFTFNYDDVVASDGSQSVTNISSQKYYEAETNPGQGLRIPDPLASRLPYIAGTENIVNSTDVLNYDASGTFTGHTGRSSQTYVKVDTKGYCYSDILTAKNLALTSNTYGEACKDLKGKIPTD